MLFNKIVVSEPNFCTIFFHVLYLNYHQTQHNHIGHGVRLGNGLVQVKIGQVNLGYLRVEVPPVLNGLINFNLHWYRSTLPDHTHGWNFHSNNCLVIYTGSKLKWKATLRDNKKKMSRIKKYKILKIVSFFLKKVKKLSSHFTQWQKASSFYLENSKKFLPMPHN